MEKTIKLRSEVQKQDTWATEDIFATDALWQEEFEAVSAMVPQYESFKGKLAESADELVKCLVFDDEISMRLERLYCYASLKADQDTAEGFYQEMEQKAMTLYVKSGSASAYISVEILELGEEKVEAYLKEDARLAKYRRVLEVIMRKKDHTLSAEMEGLLADSYQVTDAASNIFRMFNNADIKFPSIRNKDGEELPVTHGTYISYMESPDRELRKAAYESVYNTFTGFRNTLAAAFQANVKQSDFYAKARHYDSDRALYLDNNHIPEKVYDNLIEAVHAKLPAMYRYVALRKKLLGLDSLHMYDVYAPLVEDVQKTYDFEEAKALVEKGLEPMGEFYLNILREGFHNRWIDVYENKGKRSGAYSSGVFGTHPFVLLNYTETLNDVSTLAHEMGHAIHSYLSNANQPYCTADYKIFVAEVASTCNEALLNHYLLENTEDPKERAYIINNYLDMFKGTLFRQTMFAEFEYKAHKMSQEGQTLTADALCKLYHELNELYFGPDMEVDNLIDMEWARIPHFYTPFYVYQYATGFSAAIALSERILKEGAPAIEDYLSFLKGGGSKDPIDLLRMAGVDMEQPEPVIAALDLFDKLIGEFELAQSQAGTMKQA